MTARKLIGQVHLWLGLASGLVVFIVSITGCLFVFQKEISDLTYRKLLFVKPLPHSRIAFHEMQEKAQAVLGASQPVNYITTYRQPDRAWEFMAYKTNDSAITYFGGVDYFKSVFINPYDGTVTGMRDYKYDFFNIVKYLHWSLLLNTPYGQPIVGWATLIFVLLLITGLVLWWPRKWNKSTRRRSFTLSWKSKYKRLNYDLHNVLGFYSMLLALVLALTGMVFAFTWFEKVAYAVVAGTTKAPTQAVLKSTPETHPGEIYPIEIAFGQALTAYPTADRIGISPAFDKEGPVYINIYRGKEIYYDRDDLMFDQYTGKLLGEALASQQNGGQKLIGMNYDIHVGAIGGFTGKVLAFIISLICASLPVSGFLVWWWKRKKAKPVLTVKNAIASAAPVDL